MSSGRSCCCTCSETTFCVSSATAPRKRLRRSIVRRIVIEKCIQSKLASFARFGPPHAFALVLALLPSEGVLSSVCRHCQNSSCRDYSVITSLCVVRMVTLPVKSGQIEWYLCTFQGVSWSRTPLFSRDRPYIQRKAEDQEKADPDLSERVRFIPCKSRPRQGRITSFQQTAW